MSVLTDVALFFLNPLIDRSRLMATVQELQEAVAAERAEVTERITALQAEVQALRDEIANGGSITEEQLDGVLVNIKNIFVPPRE